MPGEPFQGGLGWLGRLQKLKSLNKNYNYGCLGDPLVYSFLNSWGLIFQHSSFCNGVIWALRFKKMCHINTWIWKYIIQRLFYYYTNACIIIIINLIIITIVFLAHGEVYDLPVPSKHFDLNLWPYQHLDVAFGDMCRSVFRRYIIQRFSYWY